MRCPGKQVDCRQGASFSLSTCAMQANGADETFLPGNVRLPTSVAAQQISSAVEDRRRLAAPSQAEDHQQQLPTLHQRLQQQLSTPYANAHLLPVRVTLRHKLTRRCRKVRCVCAAYFELWKADDAMVLVLLTKILQDKDAEKMSILSQPKSLPMEGDSSLLKDAGRWFYKNSAAVGICPRIVVTQLPLVTVSSLGRRGFGFSSVSDDKAGRWNVLGCSNSPASAFRRSTSPCSTLSTTSTCQILQQCPSCEPANGQSI